MFYSILTFHPYKTEPPFTFKISPLICLAKSEARNNTGPAISSAEAIRCTGISNRTFSLYFLSLKTSLHISVSTQPGAMLLTVTNEAPRRKRRGI